MNNDIATSNMITSTQLDRGNHESILLIIRKDYNQNKSSDDPSQSPSLIFDQIEIMRILQSFSSSFSHEKPSIYMMRRIKR